MMLSTHKQKFPSENPLLEVQWIKFVCNVHFAVEVRFCCEIA